MKFDKSIALFVFGILLVLLTVTLFCIIAPTVTNSFVLAGLTIFYLLGWIIGLHSISKSTKISYYEFINNKENKERENDTQNNN